MSRHQKVQETMKHGIVTTAMAMAFAAGTASAADEAMSKADFKAQQERIEADYKAAKEQCDILQRDAKDVCRRDAKATYEHAKGQAKVAQAAGKRGVNSGKTLEEREQARQASTDAQYAAAQERCETLSPQARDNCMNEVRRKYGKL